jgi:hypothetical protein
MRELAVQNQVPILPDAATFLAHRKARRRGNNNDVLEGLRAKAPVGNVPQIGKRSGSPPPYTTMGEGFPTTARIPRSGARSSRDRAEDLAKRITPLSDVEHAGNRRSLREGRESNPRTECQPWTSLPSSLLRSSPSVLMNHPALSLCQSPCSGGIGRLRAR